MLTALAVIQLAVVFTIFVRRASLIGSVAPPSVPAIAATSAPAPASATPVLQPVMEAKPETSAVPPVGNKPDPALENKAVPAAAEKAPQVPVPNPQQTAPSLSQKEQTLAKARHAREKGDMTAALAGFRQAQKAAPDDPTVVSELAMTYEAMGLTDKALGQWRRVVGAGEKAGDLYGVATEKLREGVGVPDASLGRDAEGLQPGSTLGLVDTQKIYEENPDNTAKVSIRVAVKSRSTTAIVPGDVSVQVMFYELVNNRDVEETSASFSKVTSEWITTPPDWREDHMEVLRVVYQQRTTNIGDPGAIDPEQRKYLGYIAKVYYKNELQDVRAEPTKLLQLFPPKVTLTSTTEIPR